MCIFALNIAQKRLAAGCARTGWKSLQRSPTSPSWIKGEGGEAEERGQDRERRKERKEGEGREAEGRKSKG